MTNAEFGMMNELPKIEALSEALPIRHCAFVILSSFAIRHSSFLP